MNCIQKVILFFVKVIEGILFVLGRITTFGSVLLLLLSITHYLYTVENTAEWLRFILLMFALSVANLLLALVELFLAHRLRPIDLTLIISPQKAKRRTQVFLNVEGIVLWILVLGCFVFEHIYLGISIVEFANPWWEIVAEKPGMLAVIVVFAKAVQNSIWEDIAKQGNG